MKNKREFWRVVKYLLLSASAGLIQIITFELMWNIIGIPQWWICNLTALVLSVLWNFTLNRKVTFYSAGNVPLAMLQVALYYAVFTPLSTWWTALLTGEGFLYNEYLVLAGTMIINFATEYAFERLVVFRKTLDTAKKKG